MRPWSHRTLTSGLGLHVAEVGAGDRVVIALHGFPERWWAWEDVGARLADAGLHVVAPDQRGCGDSPRPMSVGEYALPRLGRDILDVIDDLGCERVDLIGHDWGGAVAWWLASNHPERFRRVVILNCPHPQVLRERLWTDTEQRRRSAYMAFFQLPWVSEFALLRGGLLERALLRSSVRGTFSPYDRARFRRDWNAPGAMTGMLSWYRAIRSLPMSWGDVTPPLLLLWGVRDHALAAGMATESVRWCRQARLETMDATHWLHHERPEEVARRILDFLEE